MFSDQNGISINDYTGTDNYFEVPCDGLVRIYTPSGASNIGRIRGMRKNNVNAFLILEVSGSSGEMLNSVFLPKGIRIYVENQGNINTTFIEITQ